MTISPTQPTFPVLGFPSGYKLKPRVDFRPNDYAGLIETKGYLIAWERAAICPCRPVVTQTEQPDPNCPLCLGAGWLYFGLTYPQDEKLIGTLDEVQKRIVANNSAMVIRGIITALQNEYSPWDRLGNWMAGSMMLTTRYENKIGYYDRLTILDSEIIYAEKVVSDGTGRIKPRYLATGMNYLRSFSRVYKADTDFTIEKGEVVFRESSIPENGVKLSLHYLCHPTVLVVEHPHIIRQTAILRKASKPKTPQGDPRGLPIQAMVRFDFIPEPTA